MDETIAKFTTPESCEQFALNVQDRDPERAKEARRRAVELRALQHGAETTAERECLEAVYAYERVLSDTKGKKVRASRTWQMIERRGLIPAVEYLVTRTAETTGYKALASMGMQDKLFEMVVLRHPENFSHEAQAASKRRLRQWGFSAP